MNIFLSQPTDTTHSTTSLFCVGGYMWCGAGR